MDYEKEYKKLKAGIKNAYLYAHTNSTKAVLEHILPELRESVDERIRKAILKYFTKCWENCKDDVCGEHVEDIIAWIEKLGEQKTVWTDYDRTMVFNLMRDVYQMTSYISNLGKNERLTWLNTLEDRFNKKFNKTSEIMEELIIGEKARAYDGYMDEECIELCDKLNSLSSIETTESCCGHCKDSYMIFFNCYDFIRLGKLYRCVNRNYSDGKWRIECCCSDGSPIYGFLLISKEPFNSKEEMMKSVNELIENIDYWEDPTFDDYFKNGR